MKWVLMGVLIALSQISTASVIRYDIEHYWLEPEIHDPADATYMTGFFDVDPDAGSLTQFQVNAFAYPDDELRFSTNWQGETPLSLSVWDSFNQIYYFSGFGPITLDNGATLNFTWEYEAPEDGQPFVTLHKRGDLGTGILTYDDLNYFVQNAETSAPYAISSVPEPTTLGLMAGGLALLGLRRRITDPRSSIDETNYSRSYS